MRKLFGEYGGVILEVLVLGGLAALIALFFNNGSVQTMFSDLFKKLTDMSVMTS